MVDASNPFAEEQIRAVTGVLKELGCEHKDTLLVLNKIDRVTDPSLLHVLEKHHPRTVAISAGRRLGLDKLEDAVIEMLSADFVNAQIVAPAGNGRVLAYLSAHAEVYHQEFHEDRVTVRCYLPRFLVRHLHEPDVEVKMLDSESNHDTSAEEPA